MEMSTVTSVMFEDSGYTIYNSFNNYSYLENTTVPFMNITNCSTQDWIYPQLSLLSQRKAVLYLPVIIFLFLLMLFGCFGNSLVLYIYCFRSKKRSANNFIIAMALFDFITSVVVMPIDIYDLLYHYSFYSNIACKIFRAVESATTYASAVILIQIAFDRYFKICKPLHFGNRTRTKCMSISAGMLALILCSPAVVLFGTRREQISGNLCGFDCSVDQKYKGSTFQTIYYLILGLVFIITFVILSALYFLIWLAIKRRKGVTIGENPRQSVTQNGRKRMLSSVSDDDSSSVVQNHKLFRRTMSSLSTKSKLSNLSERLSNIKASRTTKIFIAVTIAFVLSYLPSVGVMICRSVNKKIEKDSSEFVQVLLKLFSRCHYLNNAANPIIYSFLNKHFRDEITKLTKSIGFCCKHRFRPRSLSTSSGSSRKGRSSRSNSYKSERTHEYELEHLKH
ncbi:growth hormone secretagogue receptor type 1-like [Mytilus trossulus]|uniref:growth hormone secretagogue receptor type 1-like n=1 Tax=Mytilus trossulus TaxID=6551 RepID=UPI0030075CCC